MRAGGSHPWDVRFKARGIPQGEVKMATMIRCGLKWTARIVVDIGPAAEKRVATTAIGMNMGLPTLATRLDGTEAENPRWIRNTGVGRDRVWRGTFSPPYLL
jgi:hypothetical protein